MVENYVANCPISMPVNIHGLIPEVDFGGVFFSYDQGLMYVTTTDESRLTEPKGL